MAVYDMRNDNSGGGLGGFLGPLALVSSFVPGLQPLAAGLGAVNSAMQGDITGVIQNGAKITGGMGGGAKTGGTKVTLPSFFDDPQYLARNMSELNQPSGNTLTANPTAQYAELSRPYRSLNEIGVNDALRAFLGRR